MLKEKNRLQKQKDFEKVFKCGRSFKKSFLYLKANKNGLESTRFGFVVSLKVSKKAVDRNRIKRLLREIVATNLQEIAGGYDIVIVVNPGVEVDGVKLQESLNILLHEAGIFKTN